MRPARAPFALDTPVFSFAGLAALSARAPLGGAREVAIVAFTAARLAAEVLPGGLSSEERQARAAGTRRWMATLSLAEPVRKAFLELIAATEADAPRSAAALRRVIEVTGAQLDAASRSEIERLAKELETQMVGRT